MSSYDNSSLYEQALTNNFRRNSWDPAINCREVVTKVTTDRTFCKEHEEPDLKRIKTDANTDTATIVKSKNKFSKYS